MVTKSHSIILLPSEYGALVKNKDNKLDRGFISHDCCREDLFVLSDEKIDIISIGDVICVGHEFIHLMTNEHQISIVKNSPRKIRKIIATTSVLYNNVPNLQSVFISQYIARYNLGIAPTEVDVVYEEITRIGKVIIAKSPHNTPANSDMSRYESVLYLKNGQVEISLKCDWSLDDIAKITRDAFNEGIKYWQDDYSKLSDDEYFNKFLKTNL